jgi:DUF4097 and DUF4098 domain-containing protein YvlB
MRPTRFIALTGILAGCGLVLAAAPGRPQFPAEPIAPIAPAVPAAPAAIRGIAPVAPISHVGPVMRIAPIVPVSPIQLNVAPPSLPALPAVPALPGAPAISISENSAPEPPTPTSEMDATERTEISDVEYSSNRNVEATTCADLHMEFDGRAAIMESEDRTLTKAEASALRIDNLVNAGVQLRGWDKDTYSVTACKFADRDRSDAKELLSQIKMSVDGGHVSVSGPSHGDHWNVQLLVRTPRGANLEIKTQNGPASFSEVDGKIFVRAQNGPVSMSNCTGEADIASQNGPISISGNSGKLKLHTENGPISVALQGSAWTDGGLVADAVNGPISLSVPSELKTSFVLESKGHSPVTCHASVCADARKTFDEDDNRRIEYGSGTPVIRLTTVNGPVTLNAL